MMVSDVKWPAKKRRGRYSNEFKRGLVKACEAPGVSTASIALANGVNANLLRRWVSEFRDALCGASGNPPDVSLNDEPEFIRLDPELRETSTPASKIDLVLQRGEFRVSISGTSVECAEFIRALFK
jgi:transposase